jgi:hypothetical protein
MRLAIGTAPALAFVRIRKVTTVVKNLFIGGPRGSVLLSRLDEGDLAIRSENAALRLINTR